MPRKVTYEFAGDRAGLEHKAKYAIKLAQLELGSVATVDEIETRAVKLLDKSLQAIKAAIAVRTE